MVAAEGAVSRRVKGGRREEKEREREREREVY
jgi:hypothetical protein